MQWNFAVGGAVKKKNVTLMTATLTLMCSVNHYGSNVFIKIIVSSSLETGKGIICLKKKSSVPPLAIFPT